MLSAPVMIIVQQPGGRPRMLLSKSIDVLASETVTVDVTWVPVSDGAWTVITRLFQKKDLASVGTFAVLESSSQVQIGEGDPPAWQSIYSGGWPRTEAAGYLAALGALASLVAVFGIALLRRAH